jgi:hypothetical protein
MTVLSMPGLIYALALPLDADEFLPRPVVIQSFERDGAAVTLHHDAPADSLLALYVDGSLDYSSYKPPTFAGVPVYQKRSIAEQALKLMWANVQRGHARLADIDRQLLEQQQAGRARIEAKAAARKRIG